MRTKQSLDSSIMDAAKWLADNRSGIQGNIVIELRKHFSLSATETVEAIQLYQKRGGITHGA